MISVIIPMYNSSSTIERCLNSVLNQSYQDDQYEIIVVNDGSKDDSAKIVEKYVVNNSLVDLKLYTQNNKGVSAARNLGLRKSKGDYIAFLDSDDEWLPKKIKLQIAYLKNEYRSVDFVCGLRNDDKITFPYSLIDGVYATLSIKKLLLKVIGQTSTAIFKRNVLENTGYFDEDQNYSEDANYWMRISINNKMIILNEKLVTTSNNYGQDGLSSNLVKMEEGVQKNIREMFYLKKINFIEYYFFKLFSKLKYLRRIRNKKND